MRGRAVRTALALCCALAGVGVVAQRPLHAQQHRPASVDSLYLDKLYELVMRESPRAAAARALARATMARVPGASLPPDPQLQLGFMNYMLPSLRPMDPLGMTQLQLVQMIPVPGKLGLAGRVAREQGSAAGERATDAAWDVRTRTAAAFYDLYEAEQGLAIARETLGLLREIERTAESLYRVGEGRQADVLRAQVEIARMAEDTLRLQAARTSAVARVNSLAGRSPDSPLGSPALPLLPDTLPTLDSLQERALAERPMLRAGEADVRAAESASRLARREIWPDLEVGVQYGQRGSATGTERMGSLMLGASVPIFARSRQLRMREEADAMRAMAAAELASLRAETQGRIAEVHADLVRARRLAALYRRTVLPLADATAASALAAYRVGKVDFMTLLDDRMTVNRYRRELVSLQANEGRSWAELEMLLGRELFDANDAAPLAAGSKQ
jgi:outer membrane protein TolC